MHSLHPARPLLLLAAVFMMLTGCARTEPDPAPMPRPDWVLPDFEPLFDGVSLTGWRGLGRTDIPAGHWVVEDSTIRKVASSGVARAEDGQVLAGGDLISMETFGDFDLRFEWKVAPGSNGGIKYNVDEAASIATPPATGALGFEYQILDDSLHVDRELPSHRAGSLYDLVAAPDDKPIQPPGTFNQGRIYFHGGQGEHWLNGALIVRYDVNSDDFRAAFQASKYAGFPDFPTPRNGHIVLQDHGDDVWIRRIQIRRLDP